MSQLPDDAWQTYKRLLSYVKPHALILFASVIGYAIYAATQAGAAQLAGRGNLVLDEYEEVQL